MKRRNKIRSNACNLGYAIMAWRIRHTDRGVEKVTPLFSPPCDKCSKPATLRSSGEINRARKKGTGNYCSMMCAKGKEECIRYCQTCNKEFRHSAQMDRENRGKYCSKKCYRQWQISEENRGHKHPSWKGGYNDDGRHSPEYRRWREAVFERDDFICQKCNMRGNRLQAHHFRPWAQYPEYRFDINNGITLCKTCHVNIHSKKDPCFLYVQ